VVLLVGDVTNWYQSQGFNTEPGWAMLVEVEAKVSENNCCRNGQNSRLEARFQVEIVSRGTNFEPQNIPECQEVTLVML
jgi:hypothetical protein